MKIEIRKSYYENGNLWSEIPYVNDKEHGIQKIYYENGKLYSEIPYKNGKTYGVRKDYYPNGNISLIFNIYQNNWFGIDLDF